MKKLYAIILSLIMVFASSNQSIFANDEKEMRAAWISTIYNMDWPKTKNNPEKQKQEYIELLDKLKATGINTVVVQVRPKGDAIYPSSINTWSDILTGTQGKDPGYDPLKFLIDEAHKRGLEFHAWFNPYRITTSTTDTSTLPSNHPAVLNPDWVLQHENGKYDALAYNPGLPEVRKHVVDSVMEVVKNYDVDGVHFDDYFYRSGMNDDETYKQYGNGKSKEDWRRDNVNTLLRDVKNAINSVKPSVEFGVSPSGIWKNKSSDPTGSDTRGKESYYSDFADTRTWIRQELVDYVVPQLYWPIGYSAADYSKLVSWWSNEVKGYDVDLYIGQGVYKQGESSNGNQDVAGEIKEQIALNRNYSEIKGSVYFSARDILRNDTLQEDMKDLYVNQPTIPSINTKDLKGNDRYETAVQISKEGWNSGAETVILVNGYSLVDGITATPLATNNDAPILLIGKDSIPKSTKEELVRLNPKNVIFIGGENSINESAINEIKTLVDGVNTKRIGGNDRYHTSLLIADEISNIVDVNKVYITGGYSEVDALSIAAKAGEEKQPIVLSGKNNIDNNTYSWLKDQNLIDAYFIGGESSLSNNIINKVNSITSNDVSKNRVSGNDRQETNAKVIEKFYSNSKYSSVLVTNSYSLVDALTAGPLAAKLSSPIVIVGNNTSPMQNTVLENKSTDLLYKIGGGVKQTAFNKVMDLLK